MVKRQRCTAANRSATPMLLLGLIAAAVGLLVGCEAQQPRNNGTPTINAATIPSRTDIRRVHAFWRTNPWITVDGRLRGIQVRTYFVSAETERGAFVDGDIVMRMFARDANEQGELERRQLYEWILTPEQAMGFRVRKEAAMGYSYGLVLSWPSELRFPADEVDFVVGYRAPGGRFVATPPKPFRLP